MDVALLEQHYLYAVPVGIVLVCAVLVYVFGFKKAEQPPFAQLSASSDVDRKQAAKKRGKVRDKRAANGQVTSEKASPTKKVTTSKAESAKKNAVAKAEEIADKYKDQREDDNKLSAAKKEKNQAVAKTGKENKVEQAKNKKNLKNLVQEKPVDYDEGDWEQAYSRKDKKNKKKEEETPSKKNKKTTKKTDLINEVVAKQEKPETKDKVAKETENKELKEKDRKDVILTPISNEEVAKEKETEKAVEETKIEKVEKIEKEEKKSVKSKKSKSTSEGENTPSSVPSTPKAENKPQKVAQKKVDNQEKIMENLVAENVEQVRAENAAVFDELGDVWTEAKPQKKSKKKARKDN